MIRTQLIIAGLLISLTTITLPTISQANMLPSRALQSAEEFLEDIDQDQWEQAYQQTAEVARLLYPKQQWVEGHQRLRKVLGPTQERQLTAIRARDHYPGLPDGDYLIVLYTARTPAKENAREMLVLRAEGDTWQVCRYTLR